MRYRKLGRAGLGIASIAALGCGGASPPVIPTDAPVVAAPTPAAKGAPRVLLVATANGDRCDWAWLTAPAGTTKSIATASCDWPFLLAANGRVFLAGDALVDLTTGAVTTLPALPTVGNGEAHLELTADGAPIALGYSGYGEETWGEGPSWEHTISTAWRLERGAWVEAASYDSGEQGASRVAFEQAARSSYEGLLRDEGPDCELDAAPLREAIEAAIEGGSVADRWCVDRLPASRVAWGLMQSEASTPTGPVMVSDGPGWKLAPGLGADATAVDLQGDFLTVDDGGGAVVYDLESRSVVFRARRALFVPSGGPR